ncbi:MAG: hypothetical protein QNJ75_07800 [Acidimicrobiia bacterium]|nr:hypothetical protein [Acidimicrobiia bacterium]
MKNSKLLVLLIALALAITACGDSLEEQVVEQILESGDSDISDIDIDSDSGEINISIEGEDGGEVSISGSGEDDDFSMVIEGEDGEVMTIGSGEIPEGLQVPVPDGGKILTTFSSGEDIMVMLEYPASQFDQLVSVYDAALDGDEVQRTNSTMSTDEGTIRSTGWYGNVIFVTLNDCHSADTSELDSVCLQINQTGS